MINFDFWHSDSKKDIAFVTVSFYPNEGLYRGNLFDSNKKAIGDFTSDDSVEIERRFPGIFGE